MTITDRHVATLKQDGFVAFERLIPAEDIEAALEAAFTEVAPPWERRAQRIAQPRAFFPYGLDALNQLVLHPRIIAAAERLMGTREIQLLTGYVMVKYSDGGGWRSIHVDYPNNTLGPEREEDDFQHLSFFVHLDEVDALHAPILMLPNGQPESAARPITGPAGTVVAYSIYTRHSPTFFAAHGHRATMWINVARKDRPWDQALRFDAHNPANIAALQRIIPQASPRQLEFLGFPAVGDPLWTPAFLRGMARRYPGFDPARFQAAAASAVA